MLKTHLEIIESICYRLNNSVTPSRILKWLENFREDEIGLALSVLNNIEYLSTEESIREFDLNLQLIFDDIEKELKSEGITKILSFLSNRTRLFNLSSLRKNKVVLHPISDFLKSGTSMFYLIKQTPTFEKYRGYISIAEDVTSIERKLLKNSFLILVDDIIGSGNTLSEYYTKLLKPILVKPKYSNVKVIVLSIIYLEKSIEIMNLHNFTFYGNLRNLAFSKTGSVFGYRPKMKQIREFVYRYGLGLYTTFDYKSGKLTDHPLGHNNSQALVVFSHSTPNNTLPIIWSNKNGWKPLFLRRGQDKIDLAYNLKYDTYKWISLLEKVGFENLFKNQGSKYNKINLQQLMILRLKKMRKTDSSICQYLGINKIDLSNLIKEGVRNSVFTKKGKITEYGEKLYSEISKKEALSKKNYTDLKIEETNIKNIYYLPSMFRGFD